MSLAGLRRRLHLLAFVDEFGPVYAVYTLWFNDNGVSTAQISTAFLVWALVALALEIPSGALADRVDRRRVLAAAFLIRAVGISVWLVWPTFAGLLAGAVLWAVHDSLASGTWEATIHDELTALGEGGRYQRVMARISQFSHIGVATGTLTGAAMLALGAELDTLGWLTMAVHAGSITLVLRLPDVRWVGRPDLRPAAAHDVGPSPAADTFLDDVGADDPSSYHEWWATLRAGLREARRSPLLARLIVAGATLEGLFILDEYLPLLARARGGDDFAAPIIVFVVWVGLLVGGEVAARRPALGGTVAGGGLIAAVGVASVAFVVEGTVWTLLLIAVAYAALEATWIVTDARLQEHAPAATRATVASVRGFGSAGISMLAFVVIGGMSDGDDPTPGHYPVLVGLVVAGALVARWLPPPQAPSDQMGR